MNRPGYLAGFESYTPKASKYRLSGYTNFGFFGKGAYVPPPMPPGAALPDAVELTGAINKQTNTWYKQDARCPEGEKWFTQTPPCQGDECCDAPGDCDPPGTVYQEQYCDDDPDYIELPVEPPEGWKDCNERRANRYPDPCNAQTCPSCAEFRKQPSGGSSSQIQAPKRKPKPCPQGKIRKNGECIVPPCPKGQIRKGANCEWPPCPPNHKREGPNCLPPCPQQRCNRPPPQNAKCRVPGYGYKNLICKTVGHGTKCRTDWMCPTGADVRMGRVGGQWNRAPKPKAAPKAKPLQGYFGDKLDLEPHPNFPSAKEIRKQKITFAAKLAVVSVVSTLVLGKLFAIAEKGAEK